MNIPFKFNINNDSDNDFEIIKEGVKTGIFILKNVISEHDRKSLIDVIDKYSGGKEEIETFNNVHKSTCLTVDIEDSTTREKIENKLDSILSDVRKRASKYTPCEPELYECAEMRKIHGPTRFHIDGVTSDVPTDTEAKYAPQNLRCLSVIIAINGDYKGGEFIFPHQNVQIKLKAGEAIIFPPYWTHPHGTNDVDDTFRYTITSWFTGSNVNLTPHLPSHLPS